MTEITNIEEQLARDEGSVPYVYLDSMGFQTIGIGILVDKRKGGGLYPEEISFIFQNRLKRVRASLLDQFPWTAKLDDARFGVLVNICFQLGIGGLAGFKNTLAMIQSGDYAGASDGMLASTWAKQTPLRAGRLALQMKIGVWQ